MTVASVLGLFLFGAFTTSLVEYVHHRHGGHLHRFGARLQESHQAHHRDPMEGGVKYVEKIRQRLPLVLVLSALFYGVFALLFGLVGAGVAVAGMIAFYLYSEGFHHTMHHRAPHGRVERWMWRHHYYHHFVDPKANFGFTSPLWDYVLGTRADRPEILVPADRIPDWPEEVPGIRVRVRAPATGRG